MLTKLTRSLLRSWLWFAFGLFLTIGSSVAFRPDWSSALAQVRSITQPSAALALPQNATLASFIPVGLPQSNNPAEGSRAVIRNDDRVPVTSRSYPWSAIGRVEFQDSQGDSYICTGTLVKPEIVLTNAHCVVDPDTQTVYENIQFAPNLIDGSLKPGGNRAQVIDLWAGTDFSDRSEPPHPDDWAFLKLDRPLGETYGTIGWQSVPLSVLIENPEQFTLVGYSADFPANNPGETAGAHKGCSILGGMADQVLRHNCDTFGGSSGGPILAVIDGEYTIVAVNSSEKTEAETGTGIVNFATQIDRIVEQIQAASGDR